jgi:hypothetical protein
MSIRKIEAVVDAVAYINRFHEPDSAAYQLKNPLLARAYSFKHIEHTDVEGRRIFSSLVGGYRFAVQDITWKMEGQSRAKGLDGNKLKPESTLRDLLLSLRHGREEDLFTCVDYIVRALKDDSISLDTPLAYFLENDKEGNLNA